MTAPTHVIEALRAAREFIAVPEQWSPDGEGYPEKKCAIQALDYDMPAPIVREALKLVRVSLPGYDSTQFMSIAEFNDSHKHEDVVALYDRAIALATSEETPA